jgi:bla regulator protein blaR1
MESHPAEIHPSSDPKPTPQKVMNLIDPVYEWLLSATLRASVLVVVILALQYVLRRWLPAAWRHALWLPMLGVLLVPALFEAPFAIAPRSATPSADKAVSAAMPQAVSAVVPEVVSPMPRGGLAAISEPA